MDIIPNLSAFTYLRPCLKILIQDTLTTHLIGKQHSKNFAPFIATCLAPLLTIIIMTLIVLVSLLIHAPIKLILKFRFPKKYAEFLGKDSYYEDTKNRTNCLYMVECSGEFDELYQTVRESCNRLYNAHHKFSSTVHSFCGYYYLLKQNVDFNDIVHVQEHLNDFIDLPSLKEYLIQHCFDWNNKALWRAIIFNKRLNWGDPEKKYYPIALSFNHCIGDGMSLCAYLKKYFFNQVKCADFDKIAKNSQNPNILNSSMIGTILLQHPKIEYKNLDSASNSQNLVWFIEKEPKYVEMIRSISKKLNCSFTDVITTAAVTSICRYLKEEDINIDNLIIYNTTRPLHDNPKLILKGNLSNEFTLNAFYLPCIKRNSMLSTFITMKETVRNGRSSTDGQLIYLFQTILSHIHPSLLTKCAYYFSTGSTLGLTNVPFGDFCYIGKYPVANMLSFMNTFENTKFYLIVLSYKNRLHATLMNRKHLKTNGEELQLMLDNVFENIDIVYQELNPLAFKQENHKNCKD